MKVIFLDIDGVMNSRVFFEKRHNRRIRSGKLLWNRIRSKIKYIKNGFEYTNSLNHKTPDSYYTYDYQLKRLKECTCPEKWQWLAEFCNENNIKICISSVWRNHFGDKRGVRIDWWNKALIDLGFNSDIFVGTTGLGKQCRGEEIKEWLQHHQVEDYSIIDDDSDMLEEQFNHFHHSDGWFGLNPNHLYRIHRQLNNQSNYSRLSKTL